MDSALGHADLPLVARDDLSGYLAGRFADDARALRQRATALENWAADAEPRRGAPMRGPGAELSRRMAEACERVSELFRTAHGDSPESVQALLPTLERYREEEQEPSVRHVYAGAILRVRENLR